MVVKNFIVKVDVQKGILRFKENIDYIYVIFIQFTFSSMIVRHEGSCIVHRP